MEFALTKIFGTNQRDMLRQRLMGVIMVVVFIAAVLFAVVANSAAAASTGAGLIGAAAGAVVLVALMTAIYRFVPNRTFALKDIWPGAVLAGVLTELFSLLFPLYEGVTWVRHLRSAVCPFLPAGHLAWVPQPVHPHRGGVQQDASGRTRETRHRCLLAGRQPRAQGPE
jgi:hypothetical protein